VSSQLDFDPGDYHLRMMIDQMERDGRSEHAIEDAVRTASGSSHAGEPRRTPHRVRPWGFERRKS